MFAVDKNAYREFNNIVGKDIYKIRGFWKQDAFDYVIDIGAHVGIFSMMSRVLFPSAKIVAVEPASEPFPYLYSTSQVFSFDVIMKALGDGSPLYYKKRSSSIDALFIELEENGAYEVESITLPEIFSKYEIDIGKDRYLIKLDCEGGEQYLVDDPISEDILKNALQVSMEVHFKSQATPFPFWPTWREIDRWIKDTFCYHHVAYYRSNKRRGFGHYCIVQKSESTDSRTRE